ncbi:hypothetical protein JT689_01540 (plasmid) [Halobacterium sp. GSL-19]|uniref:hypothetical protein n=1 Tax=Halobacterium sp. GSL-19 TaxID=2812551 RepID=UPI001965D1C2|nr:hypothetical protein [Halobacterium sp. GSL-19]QRY21773.1 hypothetical protein JT689_01540 [Halobacterium sp. GSL-19]
MSAEQNTLLGVDAIQQRMTCSALVARQIKDAFVTVEQLLDAVESEKPLTEVDGVGPKTKEVIEEWYETSEEREQDARAATFTRTSSTSATITFHNSWADALGIEEVDA